MSEIQALDIHIPAEVIHNWGWFLAFGIGLTVLGVIAIARSVAATVVSMLFFGWLLLLAAGMEIGQAANGPAVSTIGWPQSCSGSLAR